MIRGDEDSSRFRGGYNPAGDEEAMDQPAGQPLLRVKDVALRFGGIIALDGVSFEVPRGRIVGLIGPNGAGKTTLFNCVSRLYECDRGEIVFDGQSLAAVPRHRVAALGIGRTFQNLALFASLSVLDNVMVGYHCRSRGGFLANALRLAHAVRADRVAAEKARELLALLALEPHAGTRVSELPFGTQKRVELARALASQPKLLLLDEPASGLNYEEVGKLGALIRELRARLRLTILLVEHHMSLVMSISDWVVALNFGRRIAEGAPHEVRQHPELVRAYLGG
jgi:branched-chain amino acid transport system ATP-binding protein